MNLRGVVPTVTIAVFLCPWAHGVEPSAEQRLWCEIYDCGEDALNKSEKSMKTGTVEYYVFQPRGRIAPGFSVGKDMWNRPINKREESPQKRDYDEIWIEKSYAASPNELADKAFTYWKQGKFVVSLVYSVADLSSVPSSVKNGEGTRVEKSLFIKVGREWLILNSVCDRTCFDWEVSRRK